MLYILFFALPNIVLVHMCGCSAAECRTRVCTERAVRRVLSQSELQRHAVG